jgi:MarR-like DNA-binding transcriptional regulator SgrR of sgrS sRNA
LSLQAEQPLLVPGLDEFVDHSGRGGEADRQALLAGGQPQSESNVTLAGAAVADRDYVLAASKVLAAGERISSCLAESMVNAAISKRLAKRQQMQWTKRGAHLLLQTRTRALDGTLRPLFECWYPGLANDNERGANRAVAA